MEKKNIHYYEDNRTKQGNIKYLNSRCVLDLKTPENKSSFPTLIWFHGGGMTSGDKFYPENLNYTEVGCAAVNYRLSGDNASCPDYIYDAGAAVAWVLKNIENYGGDPEKVYVSGHSAGAYLSAMIALDAKYLNLFGVTPMQLKAVFPISGQMTTHFTILNERRVKNPQTPQIYLDEYAPITLASSNIPPIIFIVGDSEIEWPVRVEENQLLATRLRRCYENEHVRFYSLPAFDHNTIYPAGMYIVNDYIASEINQHISN